MTTELNSSASGSAQRATDETLQRSTPNEDAASQRDTAGEVQDPEKKKLHEEAASHRKRAKDLEAQLKVYQDAEKAAEQATLTASQKLEGQLKSVVEEKERYKQELISAKVALAAHALGIIDPDMAALAVHKSLEYGDDGMPTNLEDALKALVKSKPYLVPKLAETKVEEQSTPAQTTQTPKAPAVPAMNPGRTSIAQPGQLPPGKIPGWGEVYKRP